LPVQRTFLNAGRIWRLVFLRNAVPLCGKG